MSSLSVFSVLGVLLMGSALFGQDSQTITLDHELQIPGKTLKPGQYTFTVEDRLEDRAIIRITKGNGDEHELVLAVPSDRLNKGEHGKLVFFPAANSDQQILQGWMCPACQSALEVVYPKDEAVKITGESAKPVMAVDPTYDRLPENLSPDDMKVVTLWLLSPKEVTPEGKGKGVEAAKYADIRNAQRTQTASASPQPATNPSVTDAETKRAIDRATAPPPVGAVATTNSGVRTSASSAAPAENLILTAQPAVIPTEDMKPAVKRLNAPTQVASTRRMPHTASNTYSFGLIGLALLLTGTGLRIQRRFFSAPAKAGR